MQFTDYVHGIPFRGTAVDIWSGKGRNSVHLAKLGFEVWTLDYIEPAVIAAKQLAEHNNVADCIHFELTEIDAPWDIQDKFFNVAIGSFSSIDIETREGR